MTLKDIFLVVLFFLFFVGEAISGSPKSSSIVPGVSGYNKTGLKSILFGLGFEDPERFN